MNRAPGPNDNWWREHSLTCGGKFTKVKEPENYRQKNSTTAKDSSSSSAKTNNKQKNDSSGISKGKGKGKGASGKSNNNNKTVISGDNNNGVDIRTLFSQQQQRDQSNSDALNRTNNGSKAVDDDVGFPSLVDKENFKNAAFSGFGRAIFNNEDVQVC